MTHEEYKRKTMLFIKYDLVYFNVSHFILKFLLRKIYTSNFVRSFLFVVVLYQMYLNLNLKKFIDENCL